MSEQLNPQNKLLAALLEDDLALLEPHLEVVELPLRRNLEIRNRPVEYVYFLDTGIASVVATCGSDQSIEVGLTGNEGMTGLPVVLDADRPTYETFIQVAGAGRRIGADKLRQAIRQSATLHNILLRYVQTVFTQMAYTALANGRYKIEERLARWLLMASDRCDGNPLQMTHDFLAIMLGTRRAGVTVALNELQKRGIIETKRRAIHVLDRRSLEEVANGSYGMAEAEYHRLIATDGSLKPELI